MENKYKNAAEINNVKEMSLFCTADIIPWSGYLKTFGMAPVEINGKAKILFVASEMEFMKIRFREFAISIFVNSFSENEAAFLLHAYNSNKFFAWSERKFFSTPYFHAQILFDPESNSGADICTKKNQVISINNSINKNSRVPKFEGFDRWEGKVYLPCDYQKNKSRNKWFYAGVSGETKKYDYSGAEDSIILNNDSNEAFRCLQKSNVTGYEWIIRENAFHSKSKTYIS